MIGTPDTSRTDHVREPLQPRQPLPHPCARDLPSVLELDFPLPSTSRFPISSIRLDAPQLSSAMPPPHPPKPTYPRHDPLHVLSQPSPPPPRVYPDVLPAPSVAPGILADGILTAKHPSIRRFLDAAAIAPPECPPLPTDERMLALIALSVFYNPLHPAHWTFWNGEQKQHTAELVQSVLDTMPTPILSPIGWMHIRENLWILKSLQTCYASVLATLPWYTTYTPAETESRMSLRKRKPTLLASARNGDETIDEDERGSPPPRKRARTRRSTASRVRAKSTSNAGAVNEAEKQDQPRVPEAVEAALLLTPDVPPTMSKTAKRERIESPDTVMSVTMVDVSAQLDPQEIEGAREPRKSLRQRERKAKAASSASPASIASTLTPSVRARGLSQTRTQSRESSAVTPESIGGGESGSSTAVSLCEEQETKSKITKQPEAVAEDGEGEDVEGPPAKKPRVSRPRAKGGSRARSAAKTKTDTVTDETKTNTTVQARPKARSRTKSRRR